MVTSLRRFRVFKGEFTVNGMWQVSLLICRDDLFKTTLIEYLT